MRTKNLIVLTLLMIVLISCNRKKELFVAYTNPYITYEGRIDSTRTKGVDLFWSGTSIKIHFEGESISTLMTDNKGDNYYNIILDNDSITLLRPDTIKQHYQLASGLDDGKHSIEIFKRTEWDRGKSTFYGFQINGKETSTYPSREKERKIEFYGNSISAGYAVEDYSGNDSPDSTYTNNYLSYASLTARHFDAQYNCICRSGIGITISWNPLIMPEMFDRIDPEDASSQWDFSLYTPDVVIVNLLQNDSWLVNMPEYIEFQHRFGTKTPNKEFIVNAYQKFISLLRNKYPDTHIICNLGNMDITEKDSKWPDYVQQAVVNLLDEKIYTHMMPYKETDGHPTIEEQQQMADSLIRFIDDNIDW